MDTELQITFRGMAPSELLRDLVGHKWDKMARFLPAGVSCRVVMERTFGAQTPGALTRANLTLRGLARGTQVVVSASHEDAAGAVRQAFERLSRRAGDVPAVIARSARGALALEQSGERVLSWLHARDVR